MKRDIKNIVRDLESKDNNDIIWKKDYLEKMFKEDPDLQEILGKKEKRPYIANMTDEEKKEVDRYNEAIEHEQIVKYLKLNGIGKEVLNFIMFDIDEPEMSYRESQRNDVIKNQYLVVMCLVHEDDMDTEYGIVRTDLLDFIVRDLLNRSNCLGPHLKPIYDYRDIVDNKYYCRTMRFLMRELNLPYDNAGTTNKYDQLP